MIQYIYQQYDRVYTGVFCTAFYIAVILHDPVICHTKGEIEMKKILSLFAAVWILTCIPANAASGDAIRPIYTTDILTEMDYIPIQGYAIDGKMMICLEDLANYGFSVYYNDEARALFVNKHRRADESFSPNIERGTVGGAAGYTYETDIRAYINGQEVEAENIGGKLAVCVEDMARLTNTSRIRNLNIIYPSYFIDHSYSDRTRTLYVQSNIAVDNMYETHLAKLADSISSSDGLLTIESEFTGDTYTEYAVKGIYRDMANPDGCNAVRFYKNGCVFNAENALTEYDFLSSEPLKEGISITDMSFSEDGKYLCFSGERSKPVPNSPMGWRDIYETGDYMLDMDTFELIKVNVQEY